MQEQGNNVFILNEDEWTKFIEAKKTILAERERQKDKIINEIRKLNKKFDSFDDEAVETINRLKTSMGGAPDSIFIKE